MKLENIKYSKEYIVDIDADDLHADLLDRLDGMECMTSDADSYMGTTTIIKRYSIDALRTLLIDLEDDTNQCAKDLIETLLEYKFIDGFDGLRLVHDCDYIHILYDA